MGPEELKDVVESKVDEVKETVESKVEDIEQNGEVAQEAKELIEEKSETIEELKGRLEEAEKKLNRPEGPGSVGNESKTPGEKLTESKAYEEFVEKGHDKLGEAQIGEIFPSSTKALTTTDSSGDKVTPVTQIREITGPRERQPRLRDLLNATPIENGQVTYPVETGFHELYTELSEDESSGNSTLSVDNANGFYSGQEITVSGEDHTVNSVDTSSDQHTITIDGTLSQNASKGDAVTSDTFEATSETALKPDSDITVEKKKQTVVTIAYGMPITRQMMQDMPRIEQYVNRKGVNGLKRVEEDHILYGNGSSEQLQGIMTHNGVPEYKWSNGDLGDSKYDAIRRGMTLAIKAKYPVTALVINPEDLEDIETQKDDNGQYVNVKVAEDGEAWRVPVIETTAMKPGEALIGAFGLGAILYDRQDATMRMSDSHKDYFMRNMKQLLIEERVAMSIERPESFVKLKFDNAPQA